MKALVSTVIALGLVAAAGLQHQPDAASLVRAILGGVEPDIVAHRQAPRLRIDGPQFVDVGTFQSRIREATGLHPSDDDVLAAAGPLAAPAKENEAIVADVGVLDHGTFIQLDSLRSVEPNSPRLVAFVRWFFTAPGRGRTYPYGRAFRMCIDPAPEGWTLVESRRVPTVVFPISTRLDCEGASADEPPAP